jgi:predicted aconitase with swiveling domain
MAKAIGNIRSTDLNVKGQAIRMSSGRGSTMTPARGLGASMVADLPAAILNAKATHRADRIAAARDRLAERVGHSDLAVRF